MTDRTYDLIFITTFINLKTIDGLLDSLVFNDFVDLCVIVVAQNGLNLDPARYETPRTTIHVVNLPIQVNSSRGRNIGIDYVRQYGIKSRFVMFPDDDSSFDTNFFRNFHLCSPTECYATSIMATGTDRFFIRIKAKDSQHIGASFWNSIGAYSMILNFQTFSRIGHFDERMGVAAQYGGGEDGDYFLRGLKFTDHYMYTDKLYSYHPRGEKRYSQMTMRQIIARFRGYAQGVIYMLCKHKMYSQALYISFKAFAGSILKFCTLDFKMSLVYLIAFYERLTFLIRIRLNPRKYI